MSKQKYDAKSISVLKGLEAVRVRPDMYVGGKDDAAINIFKEIVDNSVDEFMNGYGKAINVEYDKEKNQMIIEDNGRGIPVDMHPTEKKPAIEVLFTSLHSGGKFNKDSFKISRGKFGIGQKATNALSKILIAESFRDGKHYRIEFSKGKVTKKLTEVGKSKKTGTRITFIPDEEILKEFSKYDIERVKTELELATYINKKLTINFKCGKEKFKYYHENGTIDYMNKLNTKPVFKEPISFNCMDKEGNEYDVVLSYANVSGEHIISFVNGMITEKGTHEKGFRTGLTLAFSNFINKNKLLPKKMKDLKVGGTEIREGLYAIISLKHQSPEFAGQIKSDLTNPEVGGVVQKLINDGMSDWLEENKDMAKALCNRIISLSKLKKEEEKIKSNVIRITSNNAGLQLPEKFVDANSKVIEEREILICEGDSAGGNAKQSRDPNKQAVFYLKGKPKNSYGLRFSKILSNKELKNLILVSFGTTDLKELKETYFDKRRYDKFIILSDADTDGKHIQSLVTVFISYHFPELINQGKLYICLPPLYRITKNKKYIYLKDDDEYNKFITKELSESLSVEGITIKKLEKNRDKFLYLFENFKNKYNIDEEVLDNIIPYSKDLKTLVRLLKNDFGLTVNKTKVEGLYNATWHDFTITKQFVQGLSEIFDVYNLPYVNIKNNKSGESLEYLSIREALLYMDKCVKFTRYRFKGLGEQDADELWDTALNPENRTLLKITKSDVDEMNKILFGDNSNLRKEFVDSFILK